MCECADKEMNQSKNGDKLCGKWNEKMNEILETEKERKKEYKKLCRSM